MARIDAEVRGIGAVLASKLGLGFVQTRRRGKLTLKAMEESYRFDHGEGPLDHEVGPEKDGQRALSKILLLPEASSALRFTFKTLNPPLLLL